MNNNKLIPKHKEFSFLIIVSISVLIASFMTAAILWGILDNPLSTDFHKILLTIRHVKEKVLPLLIISIFFQTMLSLFVLVIFALRYSHKISGPMYRIKILINDFLNGKDIQKVFFRQNDFLKPLEEKLTVLFKRESERRKLIEKLEEKLKLAAKGEATIIEKKVIEELVFKLKELD